MSAVIRLLCALSVLCGLAQSLSPEGNGKRVLSFVCSVVLLAGLVRGLHGLNWESYALETGQLRQREEAFLQHSEAVSRTLDRTIIEREYAVYILDMAAKTGVELQSVKVSAQWSLEGLWLPWAAVLYGDPESAERDLLEARIEADLGIPRERLEWRANGV